MIVVVMVILLILKTMYNPNSKTGYDSDGNPCSFHDVDGNYWWYVGKKDDWDHWEGLPKVL